MKARVVSGMRPTGQLHLGHLVGALNNWVPLQDQYDCFYFVADWHALTSEYADTEQGRREHLRHGRGLDCGRAGSGEEHVLRPVARARARRAVPAAVDGRARCRGSSACRPTRNSRRTCQDRDLSTVGFLGYPLLQTADVAMYDAKFVPVGADQVAHLELSREAVRRFNNFFGDDAGRAAAAADAGVAAARHRRRQEDEQEHRQHDPPRRTTPTR